MSTNIDVDPNTLTKEEIAEALTYHCNKISSHAYYLADELKLLDVDARGLKVYRESDTNKLRAYYDRKELDDAC